MPPRRETAVLLYDCSREAGKRKTGNRMGIELENLNSEQLKAATHFEGPLLILAGAGSGKTRVLTHRIAWLIEEKDVKPWNICAITFTNKAAGEMRERVNRMVGFGAEAINVSTFHSACVRILRRFIDRIGYGTNFVIYDSDDSKNVMKDVCRSLEIDTKVYKERMFLGRISSAKDELISPEQFLEMAQGDLQEELSVSHSNIRSLEQNLSEAHSSISELEAKLTDADLEQMHWDEYDEYIVENGIQEFPGVKELLSALRQEGIRLAVATGSLNRIVEKNLEILGIEELIEATATSEDVKEGKPAPDVFLHAALQLGVEPSECLVIEDAGNGLLAAKRAGMACAGFDGSKLPSDMTLAPVVIKDYREVKPENLREYYEIQKGGSLP